MPRISRILTVACLGIAYLIATPFVSFVAFDDGHSGKAFADKRDVGHKPGDKGKQDTGKG
ncbi:hypothetical protein LXM94_12415 [Rhizobium sp. TRM95111]|nr:hypothetical protein [Rhizobium alarense]